MVTSSGVIYSTSTPEPYPQGVTVGPVYSSDVIYSTPTPEPYPQGVTVGPVYSSDVLYSTPTPQPYPQAVTVGPVYSHVYQTSPTSTDGVVIGPVYSSDPSSSTPMVGVVAWDPLNPVAAESGVAPAGGSLVSSSPNYPVLPASTQSVITAQAGVTGLGGGYQLRPATDIPPGNHPSDAAPSQWFEIIRPGGAPLRIGRVTSACVCVGVRVPKRVIGQGERALIELRAVAKPPRWGLEYAFFVNVAEPVKETLEAGVAFNG